MNKRKLQAELLGLPIPKHKCSERATVSDEPTTKDTTSGLESMKDSNSLAEVDSDDSSSSVAKTSSSLDPMKAVLCSEEEEDDSVDTQSFLDIQQKLLDFESHAEYDNDERLKDCSEKDIQEFLCTNGLSSNVYVLSSGRWSVDQEVQSSNRKPTIDQEFEQYFSMLML